MSTPSTRPPCDACHRPLADDEQVQLHITRPGGTTSAQLAATYCGTCWHVLSGSLRVLENVIRA